MNSSPGSKEYLVAMRVSRKSIHSKKNIVESGITRIPGVTIVSIERPTSSVEDQRRTDYQAYNAIDPDKPLEDGDLIWFAGFR